MERPQEQNSGKESGKRKNRGKHSLQKMIFIVMESECKTDKVRTWLSTHQWNNIFGIIDAAGLSRDMQNRIISWFLKEIHTCKNRQTLYNKFAVAITNGQLGTNILMGSEQLPSGDDIYLLLNKEDLIHFLKRNLTAVFPHQAMHIEDRFLIHNLAQLAKINPKARDLVFKIFNPSFFYSPSSAFACSNQNRSTSATSFMDKLSNIGGDQLNTFLKTGRFGISAEGLAVLVFDKQILIENGLIFQKPTWVDQLTVCSPSPQHFNALRQKLSTLEIELGVLRGSGLILKALKHVKLFEIDLPCWGID